MKVTKAGTYRFLESATYGLLVTSQIKFTKDDIVLLQNVHDDHIMHNGVKIPSELPVEEAKIQAYTVVSKFKESGTQYEKRIVHAFSREGAIGELKQVCQYHKPDRLEYTAQVNKKETKTHDEYMQMFNANS